MRFPPWLLAALLGFCLYLPSVRGTYIFDDLAIVRDDPRLASVSLWGKFWTEAYYPPSQDRLYRPLTSMSYAAEWWLFGDRPWVFHLINVLLYAADCALAAELALILAGKAVGYFAGVLFAVHPVHVEAVSYIVGRGELLSTGAMLSAMILAAGKLTPVRIISIALLMLVGLFCKEQAILLPAFVGGLFWLKGNMKRHCSDGRVAMPAPSGTPGRPACTSGASGRWQLVMMLLCWMDAAYLIIREHSPMKLSWDPSLLDWTMQPLIRAVGVNRWLIPFSVLGRYAMLMVAPLKQTIDYGYAMTHFVQPMNDPFLWLGFIATVAGAVAMIIAIFKRSWLVFWCLLGLALSYGLISNFAGLIGTIMGERLLFLPTVFFAILLAIWILKLPRRSAIAVLVLLAILGIFRTEIYAGQWNNRLRFYQRQAKENPRDERIWWLLAEELDRQGNYVTAMQANENMRRIDPDYWIGWYYAGHIAMDAGDYEEALKYLDRAWQCTPTGNLEINGLREQIRQQRGLHAREFRHNAPSTNF